MKKSKGITLIALVITIIVMLILVGVTLRIVLDENGIIEKTRAAKERQEDSAMAEQVQALIIGEMASRNQKIGTDLGEITVNGETYSVVSRMDGSRIMIDLKQGETLIKSYDLVSDLYISGVTLAATPQIELSGGLLEYGVAYGGLYSVLTDGNHSEVLTIYNQNIQGEGYNVNQIDHTKGYSINIEGMDNTNIEMVFFSNGDCVIVTGDFSHSDVPVNKYTYTYNTTTNKITLGGLPELTATDNSITDATTPPPTTPSSNIIAVGDSISLSTTPAKDDDVSAFLVFCGEETAITYGIETDVGGYFNNSTIKAIFIDSDMKFEYIFDTITYNGNTYEPGWYTLREGPVGIDEVLPPDISGTQITEIYTGTGFEDSAESITLPDNNNWFTVE